MNPIRSSIISFQLYDEARLQARQASGEPFDPRLKRAAFRSAAGRWKRSGPGMTGRRLNLGLRLEYLWLRGDLDIGDGRPGILHRTAAEEPRGSAAAANLSGQVTN